MEHKYQISKKYNDGTIILIRSQELNEYLDDIGDIPTIEAALGVASVQQDGNETETIEVDSIEFVGKNRWVVKGGWATKFGITCWPEVLKEAGIYDKLKADEVNEPAGRWEATYSRKPKAEGEGMTADKVIGFKLLPPLEDEEAPEKFPF